MNLTSKEWFDALPEDLQNVVDEVLEEAEAYQWELQDEMTSTQRAEIEEQLEVIDLTDDQLAAFREKTVPVADMVRENIGDDLVDSLMNAVNSQ